MRHLNTPAMLPSMAKLGLVFFLMGVHGIARSEHPAVPASNSGDQPCRFDEVWQYGGWKIPGLADSVPTETRYVFSNSPGVTATQLTAGQTDTKLVVLNCSVPPSGRIEFRDLVVNVIELWRYDFRGKVFAYAARYEPQSVYGGKRHATLEFVGVVFYDLDGSGNFASMRYTLDHLPKELEIPSWVKIK